MSDDFVAEIYGRYGLPQSNAGTTSPVLLNKDYARSSGARRMRTIISTSPAALVDSDRGAQGACRVDRASDGGQRRIYATLSGGMRKQVYLGTAGNPKAEAEAIAHIRAANDARANRKTVTTLKRAGIPHQIFTRGALRSRDPESIEYEIEEARARGPTWRKRIDAALKTIARSEQA